MVKFPDCFLRMERVEFLLVGHRDLEDRYEKSKMVHFLSRILLVTRNK